MGKALVINGLSISDDDAPVITENDPLLTTGSLYLLDLTNPIDPAPSGMFTNLAPVPNLAWEQCASVLGSGTSTSLALWYEKRSSGGTDRVFAERSVKGGLHIAAQTTLDSGVHNTAGFVAPNAIKDYMQNTGLAHSYYISVWRKVTRANATLTKPLALISTNTGFGASLTGDTLTSGTAGSYNNQGGNGRTPANTVGPVELNASQCLPTAAFAEGEADTSPASSACAPALCGHRGVSGSNTGYGSYVIYRAYLEDLTVSGRTYAEVAAIDYALFDAAVQVSGGRYHGDTHTDPATLAGA